MVPALLLLTTTFAACTDSRLYVAESDADWDVSAPADTLSQPYRVFLVGDAGGRWRKEGPDPLLENLRRDLKEWGENGAVIFLGDNIYCCGLPDSSDPLRQRAEQRLLELLDAVKSFPGRVVFIPGNHDWNDSRAGGLESVRRQERFVESYLDRGNTFLPDNGFPGPAEVDLTDDVTMLVIDTEWWLTDQPKSFGDDGDNEIMEPADFLLNLQEEVIHEDDKKLLVVGHHPLSSNGEHAGYFPMRDHIFPLTRLFRRAYIPLPILGSIPFAYARYFGFSEQDLAHPRYRQLRAALTRIFGQHENLIYVSGHDHNLQYFREGSFVHPQHHIISGAGSRPKSVASGHGAIFTSAGLGYATLDYYQDDSIWLSFWRVTEAGVRPSLLFRSRLKSEQDMSSRTEAYGESTSSSSFPDYRDSVAVIAANPRYQAGGFKKFFLGPQYRDVWAAPVAAPFLDMGHTAGGLAPVKRGGGLQTTSIRLKAGDGKDYVLRSLDKDPSRSIPPALQNTVAVDIVQDQVASINPFGAFVIPEMASAIDIFHTEPQLVYVPDDPRLGPFRELAAGRLMMLEDRPDDDMSDTERYGRSKKVVGAEKMYETINEDNDNAVDQKSFLRARLFDILISDWDRHRGQWRWASFKADDGNGKLFKPIPRDRDWAFNRMNGLFPSVARYFDPKFQDFEKEYGDLKGLTGNGLEQDRRLTSELARADWIEQARHIQSTLTDDVIRSAIQQLPDTAYNLVGTDMIETLIARRNRLDRVSEEVYELLAGTVDVVGSDKHERFEVRAVTVDSTEVIVYKTNRDGEIRKRIYSRRFASGETHEIRLYGLGGNDTFGISSVSPGVRVRAIGGPGEDYFQTSEGAAGSRLYLYDTSEGNTFDVSTGSVTRTDNPFLTSYNPSEYRHNASFPRAFFGSNSDDGIFVGGGARIVTHGFKKIPFASEQIILANVAAKTRAFNVVYRGQFVGAVSPFDLVLHAAVLTPNNIRNFYGLGNRTKDDVDDREFYQAQLTSVRIASALRISHPTGAALEFGPFLSVTDVGQNADRFVGAPQAGISPNSFRDQWFTGAELSTSLDTRDNRQNPKQGYRLATSVAANVGIRNATDSYGKIKSNLTVYTSPSLSPQITVAARAGVEHTLGEFPFFDASTLGGSSNLRGYRSTRFAGRTAFYQNLELRVRLFRFSAYLANGDAGVLAFVDNGRVWTEVDAANRTWHQGYGGGFWSHVLDTFTLASWIGASAEDFTFTLQLGFQY